MTASDQAVSSGGTTSSDYSLAYYSSYHSAGSHGADYDWSSAPWREFFTGVASRVIAMLEPATSLDIGCAKGLLVQALAAGGVDSRGFDISDDAIAGAHPDVRERLHVASATEPFDSRYDLISCIEVLEHLAPADAQKAIDVMCSATDVILFSSSPADFDESTHVNTQPTAQWAAWFAERGFYRRVDADVSFLAPWAILLTRDNLSKRAIVERYESLYGPVRAELQVKKQTLLETQRRLTEVSLRPVVELDDDAILARHDDLRARDNVMGLEATVANLQREMASLRKRTRKLRDNLEDKTAELKSLQNSRALKVGQTVTGPVRRMRR